MRECTQGLDWQVLGLLRVLDVLRVLLVDVRHERVALRFLSRDLLVEGSILRLVSLRVRQRQGTAWAVVALVESLRTVEGEVLAWEATSQSRLSSGLQVVSSLISSSRLRSGEH